MWDLSYCSSEVINKQTFELNLEGWGESSAKKGHSVGKVRGSWVQVMRRMQAGIKEPRTMLIRD